MDWKCENLRQVETAVKNCGVSLPLSDDIDILKKSLALGNKKSANRLAIQPMEGCDGTPEGAPSEVTQRRYDRFAHSGAGLIWFEAVSITEDGRANQRQLRLTHHNQDLFKSLVVQIKETAIKNTGVEPIIIMQATHSGRYSRPKGEAEPIIAYHNPLFEKDQKIPDNHIIRDARLMELEEIQGETALLAQQAGFDGIDLKACHRYLASELLSAYLRSGQYGGSFENRSRFLRNSIDAAKAATGQDFLITSRLNIYDGFPYPYGFGVEKNQGIEPDMSEVIQLIDLLQNEKGMSFLNLSVGNPYVNPHVNRPADQLPYPEVENPMVGLERIIQLIGQVKIACPEMTIVGSGLSYLRQFSHYLAAGALKQGFFDIAGFGRMAFAYPEFAQDILTKETLDKDRVCITCSSCTQLMREKKPTGCVVRDDFYQKSVDA